MRQTVIKFDKKYIIYLLNNTIFVCNNGIFSCLLRELLLCSNIKIYNKIRVAPFVISARKYINSTY